MHASPCQSCAVSLHEVRGKMRMEAYSKVSLHTWGPSWLLGLASLKRRLDPHPAAPCE